jgi:L-rhamnose-H+ transport protein
MVEASPFLGIGLHAVGGFFAATCYTPQKGVKAWSWQTYWLAQASFCWLLLPILGAALTIPELGTVLAEAPTEAMRNSFLLGAAYGIGGTAFGIAIRHIGFSLTYAIAVGLSSVLGTLVPPIIKGTFGDILAKTGSGWVFAGVAVGATGIALCGLAGRLKEVDLRDRQDGAPSFNLTKGLFLSVLAGFLSAVYGFALEAGDPIAKVAARHGAGVFEGNVVYIFSNSGAFLTTAAYCIWLGLRNRSFGEFGGTAAGGEPGRAPLLRNWLLSATTGLFWYGQFFFYNLGHVRMGTFKFSSWAIHMIMLVLLSSLVGVAFREWRGCRPRTRAAITGALLVLVSAVLLLTYGNHLGEQAAAP